MSFLAPVLLVGLPLALVPLIIHLIHLLRRRQVKWAAMMFLRKAQRMNKGFSKLRQYLILAFRMLAVAVLIFTVARPLAGGLLGLTGGAPDSVIILLDRSASMEERTLVTGKSKREAGLANLRAAIEDAYGKRSKLVMIDSATLDPISLENADALSHLPQTGPTDTGADIPALLQGALDYMTTNKTGRTDIWLLSDLRQTDWDVAGGRWDALRSAFSTLQGVRFNLLAYPEVAAADLGVVVEGVDWRRMPDGAELLLDIRLRSAENPSEDTNVPLRVVVNGVGSTIDVTMKSRQTLLQAQSIPMDVGTQRGWGRVEIPTDAVPANDVFHFVFDEPAPLKSVIVTHHPDVARPLHAALAAPAHPSREYEASVRSREHTAEIAWEETALIVWQSALPEAESVVAKQLEWHLDQGRSLLFLPPATPDTHAFGGVRWSSWVRPGGSALVEWWRSDAGLLGSTRAGAALPVGELEIQRWCTLQGETIPMARLGDEHGREPILMRAVGNAGRPGAYFLAAWPGSGDSSLARDGVVLYALLQRALQEGAASLGRAQQRVAGATALGEDPGSWRALDAGEATEFSGDRALRAGVLEHDTSSVRLALNRPMGEDATETLAKSSLEELFAGLDWRLLQRTLDDEKSLTSEVWRTFLLIMATALLIEALLCMPRRRSETASPAAVVS